MGSEVANSLVEDTNKLMRLVGMTQRSFSEVQEVQDNASSLLVAIFETSFGTRLAHIIRRPSALEDYIHNADEVIKCLKDVLPSKVRIPGAIDGVTIAQGSIPAINFLVNLFRDILEVLQGPKLKQGEKAYNSTDESTHMSRIRSQLKSVPASPVKVSVPARSPRKVAPPPLPGQHGAPIDDTQDIGAGNVNLGESLSRERSAALAMAEEEAAKKDAMVRAAIIKQQQSVMKRVQHRNEEELHHIQLMMDAAVRAREVETRVFEANAIRAATIRAKSAKFERKVMALRTRRVIEDMTRHTLSMRIARSSNQAAAASSLLKAVAAQQRLAAAESIRAAAEERASDLLTGQSRVAWLQHQARALNEVILEETAKQVAQRQAAIRSQKEALQVALKDMKADEAQLLAQMKAEQAHAEQVFFAHNVEPMSVGGPMGGGMSRDAGLGMADGEGIATRQARPVDTDSDRVHTLSRVQRKLGSLEESRAAHIRDTQGMLHSIAADTGKLLGEVDVMVAESRAQVEETSAVMAKLTGRQRRT